MKTEKTDILLPVEIDSFRTKAPVQQNTIGRKRKFLSFVDLDFFIVKIVVLLFKSIFRNNEINASNAMPKNIYYVKTFTNDLQNLTPKSYKRPDQMFYIWNFSMNSFLFIVLMHFANIYF